MKTFQVQTFERIGTSKSVLIRLFKNKNLAIDEFVRLCFAHNISTVELDEASISKGIIGRACDASVLIEVIEE